MEPSWLDRNADKTLRALVDRDLLINLSVVLLQDPGRFAHALEQLGWGKERVRVRVTIDAILDEDTVVETCARLSEWPDVQDRIIQSVLKSPVYRAFMADMLYRSIRDFLLEENIITQKLPVAGKLVRLGQHFASNTLERLGGDTWDMDAAVTRFLEKRVGVLDRYAEALLKQAMSEERLRRSGELVWQAIKDEEINLDPEYLSTHPAVWHKLTQGLSAALVDALLDGWGEKPLRELL